MVYHDRGCRLTLSVRRLIAIGHCLLLVIRSSAKIWCTCLSKRWWCYVHSPTTSFCNPRCALVAAGTRTSINSVCRGARHLYVLRTRCRCRVLAYESKERGRRGWMEGERQETQFVGYQLEAVLKCRDQRVGNATRFLSAPGTPHTGALALSPSQLSFPFPSFTAAR